MDLSLRTNFAQEEAWEAHARCGDEILNVHQMDEERYDDPEEEFQGEEEDAGDRSESDEDNLEGMLRRKWDHDLIPELQSCDNYFDQLRAISQHQKWLKDQKAQIHPKDKASRRVVDDQLSELDELQKQCKAEQLQRIEELRRQKKGGDDKKLALEREKSDLQDHLDRMSQELDHALATKVNRSKMERSEPNAFFPPFQIISDQLRWLAKLKLRTSPKRELLDMISGYEEYLKAKQKSVHPPKPEHEHEMTEGERSVAEKEERLEALQQEIDAYQAEVDALHQKILDTKFAINKTENSNRLLQQFKPVTVPEYPLEEVAKDEVQFNMEHDEILRQKNDILQPLKKEITELDEQRSYLEDQLDALVLETQDFQAEIVELTEAIRLRNAEGDRIQTQCGYVFDQVTERSTEIKMLERLKHEGEMAYSQLLDRAKNFDALDGGKIDIEKSVINLQNQLRALESEIQDLNTKIQNDKEEDDAIMEDLKNRQNQFETAVDWQTEKEDLLRELQELTDEIKERKASLSQKEQKNESKQAGIAKYGPLLKKWKGKTGNVEIPAGKSISQLWAEMNEARAKSEELAQRIEREIRDLVNKNGKLEEELEKRKATLQRVISQSYAEEHQFRKGIEERGNRARAEELKLLQQIQEVKLRIAQKNLPTMRK